ncbi:MBL fold metallo-hydrolase [Thermodesulfobacteriota bacterium]
MIVKKMAVGPYGSNCYIVGSDRNNEGLIIDPGGKAGLILGTVGDLELDIKIIVLTHGHVDHFIALKDVQEGTGAEVAIHANDARRIDVGGNSISYMYGYSYKQPSSLDRLLEDGDIIEAGDLSFRVIHTPWHTPGCICILGHGCLFTGDTAVRRLIGSGSNTAGRYSWIDESTDDRFIDLPDDTIIYPGHGSKKSVGHMRRRKPFIRRL